MLDRISNIDLDEEKLKLISRLKYVVFLLPIIPIYAIISYYVVTYGDVENEMVKLAKEYVQENSINFETEGYISLGQLGEVDGAELCSNASGVIVTRKGSKYKYKAYLNCTDYETKLVSNSEKYITLSGDTVTILNYGEIYEEKGYYSDDVVEVTTEGTVGRTPGIYTIKYNVIVDDEIKQTLERKVIVTEFDKLITNSGVSNSNEPTLNLFGDTIMILEKGEKYVEPGYKAVDYKDGKITRKVSITSTANIKTMTKEVGTYQIVYSVTNSKGNTASKTRTIKVVLKRNDIIVDSSIKKQTAGFTIILKITGSGYTHTILPNGAKEPSTNINYKVTKKGVYRFAVYDTFGNVIVREIDVNGIDTTGPTGSCIATVSPTRSSIYVTASDKSGIKGYIFNVDGESKGFGEASAITVSKTITEATAQVQDTYGNYSTFKCQINRISGQASMTDGIMNIPLILQTNYTKPIKWYGGTATVKRYGCGPTSVSMIVSYLTGNNSQNPQEIFEWLNDLRYFHGNGFGKAALTKAAAKYGVTCEWRKLDEDGIKKTLLSGQPIIAFVGKNAFGMYNGHYIVLKGVTSDGKIAINDPYSEKISKKTWSASKDILPKTRTTSAFAVCH